MNRACLATLLLFPFSLDAATPPRVAIAERPATAYADIVLADHPVAYWRFGGNDGLVSRGEARLHAKRQGNVKTNGHGPRTPHHPGFDARNPGLEFPAGSQFLRVADPGENSPLDFHEGDAITLEAWVSPASIGEGRHMYVLGKGRTNNQGFPAENQNYALRLTGKGGQAQLSFLFRNHKNRGRDDYHRWTSAESFATGGGWHHVAVTYVFGDGVSLRGYIDGKRVKGIWDMGGQTDMAPVVDDDELWIGSTLGGVAGATFHGGMDEVAIHRTALSPNRIRARFSKHDVPVIIEPSKAIPPRDLLVEIFENVPNASAWPKTAGKLTDTYTASAFAFRETPRKYDEHAVQQDRSPTFVLRAWAEVVLPKGKHRLLLRARNAAKVFVDGKLRVETPFHNIRGSAHGKIRKVAVLKDADVRPLQTGDTERVVTITGDGKRHRVRLDVIVGGGGKKRPELGETTVSIETEDNQFLVLSPHPEAAFPLLDEQWYAFRRADQLRFQRLNASRRQFADAGNRKYWDRRHEIARNVLNTQPKVNVPRATQSSRNEIDRFINRRLDEAQQSPAKVIDDWTFLRRVTLDVIGRIPTPNQIQSFLDDKSPDRRARYIDRLLDHPGWADHWVAYWQDVLAENPSLLKPTLNNTGPFRWWIHESFYDNKPFDRFATELIMMRGSRYYGGPGGFAMATQNDAPMAAKAHVVSQAFLGLEMKCARCHDAPFHEFQQEDLFSVAAMLNRKPQAVPKTSSIPLSEEALGSLIVKVTLKPGAKVAPKWPFADVVKQIPAGVLRDENDSRERLAALITSPHNTRFAEVIVNRLWRRYLGRGFVEPVDDWEEAEPSHPKLLAYLSREFVSSGYDLKHLARLILNSQAYQREANGGVVRDEYLFAGPVRRRMTAEQVVDSLFTAAGKDLHAGELNLDPDGARTYDTFINLGHPRRAWEFASLSNERDRPSLALPLSQGFTDVLKTFGWRSSRANPATIRDHDPSVLQPAVLANGVVGRRFTRLSEDSRFTQFALAETDIAKLVDRVYLAALTRPPTDAERSTIGEVLKDGFTERKIDVPPESLRMNRPYNPGVSWSNHLSEEANRVKIALERAVKQGDTPTPRLQTDWRERLEDVLWAMLNSPEFVFVP